MNCDILEEEAKAGAFDVREQAYPLLALNLRGRRDNLVSTINVLQERAGAAREVVRSMEGHDVEKDDVG